MSTGPFMLISAEDEVGKGAEDSISDLPKR